MTLLKLYHEILEGLALVPGYKEAKQFTMKNAEKLLIIFGSGGEKFDCNWDMVITKSFRLNKKTFAKYFNFAIKEGKKPAFFIDELLNLGIDAYKYKDWLIEKRIQEQDRIERDAHK